MRILALFDDASQSVKCALPNYEVISVGINKKTDVMQLDLSDMNNLSHLLALHSKEPFDLLIASPPCESWSIATACTGGNVYRFSENLKLRNFAEWKAVNYNNVKRLVERQSSDLPQRYQAYFERGINGEKTALFTSCLIKELGIPFIIENPAGSMIWRYFDMLGLSFIKNKANHSAYDEGRSLKPTIFASSYKLNLKTSKTGKCNMRYLKGRGDGSSRADIPSELILDIVEQVKNYG